MPYLAEHEEPFVLISTGTWSVTINPFNSQPLTPELLRRDCLSFMTPRGEATRAARVFLGREHDFQVERIAAHFHVKPDFYRSIVLARPYDETSADFRPGCMAGTGPFPDQLAGEWDLSGFRTASDAYQHLMHGLIAILLESIHLVWQGEKIIFVDGGFARNPLFMQTLSLEFSESRNPHAGSPASHGPGRPGTPGARRGTQENAAALHQRSRPPAARVARPPGVKG
ncbi:hypothetical protein ACFQT0_09995 [Hymenobacter humi]|uniref:Carbohydrate kinase FGGY C-terminal domain-containing protein n=1 Tax=Hymenobacter humi TaxID=1411620 RepID=A0ABW2U5H2_9BACT